MRLVLLVLPALACAVTRPMVPEYDRKQWRHWIDADKDCQDTRQEVLVEEATAQVDFTDDKRCRVASGEWEDPYTGRTLTSPSELDIDHVVPLRDAHDSGGAYWDASRRKAFANDLEDSRTLRAVELGANRSKGSKGPDRWLPPNESFRCQYILEYLSIKESWGLAVSLEQRAVTNYMLHICNSGDIPPLPQR